MGLKLGRSVVQRLVIKANVSGGSSIAEEEDGLSLNNWSLSVITCGVESGHIFARVSCPTALVKEAKFSLGLDFLRPSHFSWKVRRLVRNPGEYIFINDI